MNSGKDEHSGFGRAQSGVARLAVPDIADVEDVGGMHCRLFQGLLVRADVPVDLALVYYRFLIRKGELYRFFDRHDVPSEILVYVFDHGGNRGGLAAPGQAGQKDKAAAFMAHFFQRGSRQIQLFETRQCKIDHPEGYRYGVSLVKDADAEPPEVSVVDGHLAALIFLQHLSVRLISDFGHELLYVFFGKKITADDAYLGVDPGPQRPALHQKSVGCFMRDKRLTYFFEVHTSFPF